MSVIVVRPSEMAARRGEERRGEERRGEEGGWGEWRERVGEEGRLANGAIMCLAAAPRGSRGEGGGGGGGPRFMRDPSLGGLGAAADGATLPAAWARLRNFACVRGEGITITRSEGICPGAPRSARLAEPQE